MSIGDFSSAIQNEARVRGVSETRISEIIGQLVKFHELMAAENENQNLTRLISYEDFIEGHLIDCFELHRKKWIQSERIADLGSGCGVPGIPLALLFPATTWSLVESETKKGEFLKSATLSLGINSRIQVYPERFEAIKDLEFRPEVIVSRAVGPVLRVFNWIKACSTWNMLILFKGPLWEKEWNEFLCSPHRKKLKIAAEAPYTVGVESKTRRLILLERVNRECST